MCEVLRCDARQIASARKNTLGFYRSTEETAAVSVNLLGGESMTEVPKEKNPRKVEASRAMWTRPSSRARLMAGLRRSWTPERRAAMSAERKRFFAENRRMKAVLAAMAEKATEVPAP